MFDDNFYSSGDIVISKIHRIEEDQRLFEIKVDGWCVWPTIRTHIGRYLENVQIEKVTRRRLFDLVVYAIKDFFTLLHIRKSRFLIKSSTSARREKIGDHYKDIYFDDLLVEIKDFFKIEAINNFRMMHHSKQALIKSNMTSSLFDFLGLVLANFELGPWYIHSQAVRTYEILRDDHQIEALPIKWIKKRYLHFYWGKKFHKWLLNRVQPEYALIISPGNYDLFAAARERGMRTIELQHGALSQEHLFYNWHASSLKYKHQMPIAGELFLHGDFSKDEMNTLGFWGESLKVVGSLRMDSYRKNKPSKSNEHCTLLFCSQGVERQKVIELFTELLKISRSKLELELYIKLHPGYESDSEPYTEAFNNYENVKIVHGKSFPSTYELICRSHFHISLYSSTHYESLALGTPTIILPFANSGFIINLYNRGHAFMVDNAADLLDIVLQWQTYKLPSEISEYYFRSNALENIKMELGL